MSVTLEHRPVRTASVVWKYRRIMHTITVSIEWFGATMALSQYMKDNWKPQGPLKQKCMGQKERCAEAHNILFPERCRTVNTGGYSRRDTNERVPNGYSCVERRKIFVQTRTSTCSFRTEARGSRDTGATVGHAFDRGIIRMQMI